MGVTQSHAFLFLFLTDASVQQLIWQLPRGKIKSVLLRKIIKKWGI